MPSIGHHGAHIHYEEFGRGFPILTFAPAGLQSVIAVWRQASAPIDPTTEFADTFRVIALDQRNAGGHRPGGPVRRTPRRVDRNRREPPCRQTHRRVAILISPSGGSRLYFRSEPGSALGSCR